MPEDVKEKEVEETPEAETSTADEVELFETVTMDDMTGDERNTWLAKGTVPDRFKPKTQAKPKDTGKDPAAEAAKAKEKKEAEAKAKTSAEPPDKEGKDGSEPPEKEDKQEPKSPQPNRAERRVQQLSAQIQAQLAEAKSLRESIAEMKRTQAELTSASPAAKTVVAEKKETGKLKRPRMADFTQDKFDDPMKSYDDAMEAYDNGRDLEAAEKQKAAVDAAIEKDRAERQKAEAQAKAERENKAIEESWRKKCDASAKRHADFADVISDDGLLKNANNVINAVADSTILELDHGAEVLYWLGLEENEAERARIMDLGPVRTAVELGKIEARIAEGLKGKDNGKPADKKEPIVPRAPKPPTDLAAAKAVSDDPIEAALEVGDVLAYNREMNRKELAEREARRR